MNYLQDRLQNLIDETIARSEEIRDATLSKETLSLEEAQKLVELNVSYAIIISNQEVMEEACRALDEWKEENER